LAEAGALVVVESPRYIAMLLDLAHRFLASQSKSLVFNVEDTSPASIAARAWAAIPWQDA
jgi:hypothetical protein